MDILSSRMWSSPTLFRDTESEGVPHHFCYWRGGIGIGVLDFGEVKKKCLFPVGGHCRMHSLYWLDFSDFRQETHFQRRLDQFWNPRTRWGSNLVFKTTFCPKPWREIRIEAFGSDGKPLDGSKSLTEAIHQWHNWFPLVRFSYSVSI